MIYYIRDISGLTGFKYNNNIYYYVKNLQNDIIGILDSNYQEIVKYKYDSWGNILSILDNNGNDISNNSTHIANINPYRYRSYYYDKETDLYYLNSRYYNPKWGRFLNVDNYIGDFGTLSGYNLYQYSINNPISFKDEIGMWPKISFKTIVNAIKLIVLAVKTIKKLNITRKKEKPKVSFVVEVGNGTGFAGELEAFNTEVKIADYIDDTMKYQNNKIECYTESVKSLSVINGYEIKKIQNYDCETRELIGETKMVETYSTPIANYSEGKLTTFLGLEGNLHIISGGHIKIGYEIEW